MKKLYGVIPPMITPFDEKGAVDFDALASLVEFLLDRVDGLFICGSYGSGPLMSTDERKQVATAVIRQAAGRVAVVVHTGTAATWEAAELSAHAAAAGATAVSAVAPFYYHHNGEGVLAYYRGILSAVAGACPVYVYHNIRFSGYEIPFDTIRRLAAEGVAGVKDATFDVMKFAQYQRELAPSGFDVVLGTESMWLSARALGAEAYIPGLGNSFPELCREMHRSGMNGDFDRCRELQFKVNRLRDVMYLASSTQQAVYAMLELRGIRSGLPRSPFVAAGAAEKEKMRRALGDLGVL